MDANTLFTLLSQIKDKKAQAELIDRYNRETSKGLFGDDGGDGGALPADFNPAATETTTSAAKTPADGNKSSSSSKEVKQPSAATATVAIKTPPSPATSKSKAKAKAKAKEKKKKEEKKKPSSTKKEKKKETKEEKKKKKKKAESSSDEDSSDDSDDDSDSSSGTDSDEEEEDSKKKKAKKKPEAAVKPQEKSKKKEKEEQKPKAKPAKRKRVESEGEENTSKKPAKKKLKDTKGDKKDVTEEKKKKVTATTTTAAAPKTAPTWKEEKKEDKKSGDGEIKQASTAKWPLPPPQQHLEETETTDVLRKTFTTALALLNDSFTKNCSKVVLGKELAPTLYDFCKVIQDNRTTAGLSGPFSKQYKARWFNNKDQDAFMKNVLGDTLTTLTQDQKSQIRTNLDTVLTAQSVRFAKEMTNVMFLNWCMSHPVGQELILTYCDGFKNATENDIRNVLTTQQPRQQQQAENPTAPATTVTTPKKPVPMDTKSDVHPLPVVPTTATTKTVSNRLVESMNSAFTQEDEDAMIDDAILAEALSQAATKGTARV
jgi:hypothetical protein